jgi:hypothetical protein
VTALVFGESDLDAYAKGIHLAERLGTGDTA